MKNKGIWILGLCIAVGLAILGSFVKIGLQSFSKGERIVTVKGLAEKDIKADEASVEILIRESSDSPEQLLNIAKDKHSKIMLFLETKGYGKVLSGEMELEDTKTYYEQQWNGEKYVQVKKDRYRSLHKITLTIKEVEKAEALAKELNIGLIRSNLSADVSCNYTFPKLNSIKPELIAESTKNARIAGEQFAADSQSKLGKIKTASQGQISLVERNYYGDDNDLSGLPIEPYLQRARVVSTIVFFLED